METATIIMMILILGGVCGGFIYTLSLAFKKEKEKRSDKEKL